MRGKGLINNSKPQAPCKDCENRHAGCHAGCTMYQDFRKLADSIGEHHRRQMERQYNIIMFQKGSQRRFGRGKK